MALDAGTIEGYLDLDISGFLDGLSTAGDTLASSTSEWQSKTEGAGSKIGSTMQRVGAGLTLGLTTSILGAGAAAITMADQYDAASARMQSVLGLTADEADNLTDVARGVYTNGFGPSFDDVVSTATEVRTILGDLNNADMSYVTTGIQNLADTMDMDVGESVRGVNVLMESFGLSAQEAMDMFAAGAQNGLNYSDELGDNLAEYGPKLSQMGFSAEQYFQILENGTENGAYNLDKVNDFLNEFQTSLSDGRMDENIGKFSTATQELFQQWKEGSATGAEVYESVINDLNGMEDGYEKAQLASAMWSSLGEDNAMAMIEAMSSAGDTFDDVAGKSQDMADTASQSLGSQFTSLVRSVQDALADLGESGVGPISTLIGFLQQLVDGFRSLDPEAKQMITTIALIVAAIGPLILVIGTIITSFQRIQSTITMIRTGFTALSTALGGISAPVVAVVAVIAALAAAFIYLWNTNEQFRAAVIDAWNQIVAFVQPIIEQLVVMFQTYWPMIQQTVMNAVTQIWTLIQTAWPTIQQVITNVMMMIQQIIVTVWPYIQSIIQTVMQLIQAFMDNVWPHIQNVITTVMAAVQNVINTVWGVISTIFSTYGAQIQSVIENVFNIIQSVITTVLGVIQGIIQTVTGIISGDWSAVWNGIKQVASSIWNGIRSIVSSAINIVSSVISGVLGTIQSIWSGAWNSVTSFLSGAWENIKSGVSNGINGVLGFIRGLPGNILSAIGNVGNLLWDAGSSIINGLLNGLQSAAQGMFDWVGGIASTIASLKGPLPYDRKLLVPAGEAIIGGLEKSMMSSFKDVKDEVSKMGSEIADEFNSDLKPIDYDMKINIPDQKSIDKLKDTAGFMSQIAASQAELGSSKYSYSTDQSFGLTIDYNKLGSVIAENFRNAPIEANVDVTMQDGDVYMDSERVGRKVAPVVSRVQVKDSKVRR